MCFTPPIHHTTRLAHHTPGTPPSGPGSPQPCNGLTGANSTLCPVTGLLCPVSLSCVPYQCPFPASGIPVSLSNPPLGSRLPVLAHSHQPTLGGGKLLHPIKVLKLLTARPNGRPGPRLYAAPLLVNYLVRGGVYKLLSSSLHLCVPETFNWLTPTYPPTNPKLSTT